MLCTRCGLQLQPGTAICPRCGTVVQYAQVTYPYEVQQPQPTPYAPPVANYNAPPTNYNQYGPPVPTRDPYSNIYTPPIAPVFPPAQPKKGNNILVTIVGISLALLMILGVFIYLERYNTPANKITSATPTIKNTPASAQNPYGTHTGTLVLSDTMQDNSKGYKWDEATMNGTANGDVARCVFSGNTYHIQRTTGGLTSCNPEASELFFQNVTVEATMTIIKGNDAGLVVRIDQAKGTGYLVVIDHQSGYAIDTVNFSDAKTPYKTLRSGVNQAIKPGLGTPNVIAVTADGSTISLYVNGTYIDGVTDTSDTQGQIGLCGYGDKVAFDIAISNVRAWKQ